MICHAGCSWTRREKSNEVQSKVIRSVTIAVIVHCYGYKPRVVFMMMVMREMTNEGLILGWAYSMYDSPSAECQWARSSKV